MSRRPAVPSRLPPGAKSLGINLSGLAGSQPQGPTYSDHLSSQNPNAKSIVMFAVHYRPVPWRVSIHGKPPKLVRWQKQVAAMARAAMWPAEPHAGPVELRIEFRLVRFGKMPDLTNLIKGTEDAMQGIVYINDSQVKRQNTYLWDNATENAALIQVVEYTESNKEQA